MLFWDYNSRKYALSGVPLLLMLFVFIYIYCPYQMMLVTCIRNTTGNTCVAGTANPSRALEFIP